MNRFIFSSFANFFNYSDDEDAPAAKPKPVADSDAADPLDQPLDDFAKRRRNSDDYGKGTDYGRFGKGDGGKGKGYGQKGGWGHAAQHYGYGGPHHLGGGSPHHGQWHQGGPPPAHFGHHPHHARPGPYGGYPPQGKDWYGGKGGKYGKPDWQDPNLPGWLARRGYRN